MNKPHKHAELIKLWEDGAVIQYRRSSEYKWEDILDPVWSEDTEYRVKPVTRKYRVALMRNSSKAVDTEQHAREITYSASFIRWLTDWIEYEV